jgi:hypothetical protein
MAALPPQALHCPLEDGAYRMAMNLVTVPEAAWFEIDALYPQELAQKRALLTARRDAVFATAAATGAARREALATVAAALAAHHPDWFSRDRQVLRNHLTGESWPLDTAEIDPLEVAGRLVQEDLCLIGLQSGEPVFTDAVLCFPSRWSLREKIARPLADVHDTVPFYAARLGAPVDRFMRHLKPGRIVCRLNWSLLDDPALFQPGGKWRRETETTITVENAGARIFLRVERQTLRLLPESGAVLFAIRVHVYPLQDMAQRASLLATAVRALPEAMLHYKSILPFRDAVLGWADRQAALSTC